MGQHQQWIPIDECINNYLDESEQSIHKFYKLWNLAFRLMTEMGLDFFYAVKSLKLPINANLTVTLPPDYLTYTKVGVFNNVSEVIPLYYNNNLTLFQDLLSTRQQSTEDNTLFNLYNWGNLIFYNYWDGSNFSQLYGIPSGAPFVGGFKIDNANGIILLSENFAYSYICLEYIASPKEGEQYYVPIQFKEAMIAGLAWLDIRSLPNSRKGNGGDKQSRRHEYYNQRRLAKARYEPFDLQQAYEWHLRNERSAVKV